MGNCCGKSSSDNFSSPGRTVGSAAAPANSDARVAVPSRASKPTYTQTPGRTVGGATGDAGGDARAAAAKAAEARASQNQPSGGGKLAAQLAAQKRQTDRETLEQASKAERATRDADAGHEARAYN